MQCNKNVIKSSNMYSYIRLAIFMKLYMLYFLEMQEKEDSTNGKARRKEEWFKWDFLGE